MMSEGFDSENIQVGSTQLWLPSNICTDRTIFNHIFSLDTWNMIFTSEQKDRIMKMLPPEIVASPGAAVSTIEDLLSGSLTRFKSNPLETFFNELNHGGYDPEVAKLKVKMKRAWRRDSLGRKRYYHTKLMQEVIISSQECLQKLRDKTKSIVSKKPHPNQNSKACKIVKVQKQEALKPATTSKKKSTSSKPSPLRQKVAKRLHNEIQAMNQAFPSMTPTVIATQVEGAPAPKKAKVKCKKVNPRNGIGTDTPLNHLRSDSEPQLSTVVSSPHFGLNNLRHGLKTTEGSTRGIQMATFPKVIPPSLLGVINVTQSPSSDHSNPKAIPNHYDIKVPLKEILTPPPTPLISQNVMQKHVLKASPILASQLQAPIAAANKSIAPRPTAIQNHFVIKSELTHLPVMTQLSKALKTEEETSSGEDEFEAIEPTIGFFSSVLPAANKTQLQKVVNSKGSASGLSTRNHLPPNNKIPSLKKRNISRIAAANSQFGSTASTFSKSNHEYVNVKVSNSKVIITNTAPAPVVPNNNNLHYKVNCTKVSSVSLTPVLQTSSTTHSPGGGNQSSTIPKAISNPIHTNHLSANKLHPITLSNLSQSQQLNNINPKVGFFRSSSLGSSLGPFNSPITGSSGLIVNGSPGFGTTTRCSSSFPTSAETVNLTSPIQYGGVTTSSSSIASRSLSRLRTTSLSPLPLTLSDLSLSLNLGLDVTGDKLEDKIDDLPVLDGNAFDSIPNLSDDLDVFDLDLVDGLCDFEVMLSEEKQYSSFFALIREVLCSTQNHRMTFSCLEKTVHKWSLSPSSELNPWFHRIAGWNEALITALNFLAGNYQEIHPEDFVPYLEYKYKTKYYQWIGAGRDSDGNLLTLCHMWLENLERLPPVKKQDGENEEQEEEEDENEDSDEHTEEVKKKYLRPKTPPPPRFVTEWTVRPSTSEEKEEFQVQEKVRFDNPHKAFTYRMHKYESVVGPVKGVYSNQTGVTNKARGHSLLVDDRPPYVTILALVRDSVARLPNGEGTRSEICEMLRDSTFLAPEASNVTLNSVVSGALDRLHYERDPCVRYDSHKKNWIYLHRDRSQEQFERLHHNRSYTKSTKSRNNGGRKSRKKTLSQNSATSAIESASSASAVQSSNSSVSSTPATAPKLTIPPLSGSGGLITLHEDATPTLLSQNVHVAPGNTISSTINSTPPAAKPATLNNIFVSAKTSISPAVQFAIPVSSNQNFLSKTWVSSDHELLGQVATPTNQQSLPNLSSAVTANLSTPVTTTMLLQNAGNLLTNTQLLQPKLAAGLKSDTQVNTSSPTTGTTNCVTPTLQQQSFILNNIFRLPNLKLPENVRFMRLQSAPAGQVQLNPLRLPQQRIVLRQAIPGYVPGQGVIFGQTPSGQTVIISAIGSPQVLSTQSFQTQPTPTQSAELSQPQICPTSTVFRISTAPDPGIITTAATTSFPGNTSMPNISKPRYATNIAAMPVSNILPASTQLSSPTPPIPFVRLSSAVQTNRSGPSIVCQPTTNNKLPQPEVMEVAQYHGRHQVGGSVVTTPASTTLINTRLPNSPVVIRSNPVEYHNSIRCVSMGSGGGALHGIKMIPVTSSGNQIFARLLSPTRTEKPTLQSSTTTKTQALL